VLAGSAAAGATLSPVALILATVLFLWTPPHFWALALYRKNEYAKIGMPMLPVTHGDQFTRLHVLLYTVILCIVTVLPYITQMSGMIYLASAIVLNGFFMYYAIEIYRNYSDALARKTFRYSIIYLALLFVALLVDHYYFF
jgi:protoheme IX farnesyltransferase